MKSLAVTIFALLIACPNALAVQGLGGGGLGAGSGGVSSVCPDPVKFANLPLIPTTDPPTICVINDAVGQPPVGVAVTSGSGNPNTSWAMVYWNGNNWIVAGNAGASLPLSPDMLCSNGDPTQCVNIGLNGIPLPTSFIANQVITTNSASPPTALLQQPYCPNVLTTDTTFKGGATVATCPTALTLPNVAADGQHSLTYSTSTHTFSSTPMPQPSFTRVANGCTTSGTANTVTTCITSGSVTVPTGATGQLWRILVDWVACTGTSTITTSYQISDGTNTWADREIVTNLTAGTCSGGSGFSPVTYANGASVTLNLNVSSSGISSTISATSTTTGMTKTTYMDYSFVAVNN